MPGPWWPPKNIIAPIRPMITAAAIPNLLAQGGVSCRLAG
jgi:hypothetical protein